MELLMEVSLISLIICKMKDINYLNIIYILRKSGIDTLHHRPYKYFISGTSFASFGPIFTARSNGEEITIITAQQVTQETHL